MKINLLAFGIAKDIVGGQSVEIETADQLSVGQLREHLVEQFPEFAKLKSLKLAVNGAYVEDHTEIEANDEVVIIPPVSGG